VAKANYAIETPSAFAGAVVATIADFLPNRQPRVHVRSESGTSLVTARSCVRLSVADVGRQVLVLFEEQDFDKPIIVGALTAAGDSIPTRTADQPAADSNPITVDVDGQRVVLSAKEEVVLKCGKASITLTRAGKILIRGAYVSSHSTSVNRIKGGSVEIN